jgi:hypothetical protein
MRYSVVASGVILVLAAASALEAVLSLDIWFGAAVNIACFLVLIGQALAFHQRKLPHFDPIVAAEMIVAFGVAALIFSLGVALWQVLIRPGGIEALASGPVQFLVLRTFVLGLASAGLAPLLAMFLRIRVSEADAAVDPVADTLDVGRAMASLSRALARTETGLAELEVSVGRAVISTRLWADSVETESGRLKGRLQEAEEEFGGLAGAIRVAGQGISAAGGEAGASVVAAGAQLADGVRAITVKAAADVASASQLAADAVLNASQRAAAGIETAGVQAGQTIEGLGRGIDGLASETVRFKESLTDTTALLQAVAQLTAEVRRFIEPATQRAG